MQSFSISRTRGQLISSQALRDEVQGHTQNDLATSRILSAIERFGDDPSIERFEMIPANSRTFRAVPRVDWTVRAFRSVATRPLLRPWER